MNIVTMCRGGNVRSVAAKMVLQRYFGYEVIAVGADNTNNTTKSFLSQWADLFVVMSKDFMEYVPLSFGGVTILLDVGNDVWGDPFNEELQLKIFNLALNNKILSLPTIDTDEKAAQVASEIPIRIKEYKAKIAARNKSDSIV